MYNVKVIHYLNNEKEIRVFKSPVYERGDIEIEIDLKKDLKMIEKKRRSDFGYFWEYDTSQMSWIEKPNFHQPNFFKDELYVSEKKEEKSSGRSLEVSLNRTINQIYKYSRSNLWEYFVTLTFDPLKVDRYSYDECCKKMKNFLDSLRRKNPYLKYLGVPEQHRDGAWHFHFLMSNIDSSYYRYWKKDRRGNDIYILGQKDGEKWIGIYRYGWSTLTFVKYPERVSMYITKYITKGVIATTFGKKRYWCSKNLDLPKEEVFYFTPAQKKCFLKRFDKYIVSSKKANIKNNNYENEVQYLQLNYNINN